VISGVLSLTRRYPGAFALSVIFAAIQYELIISGMLGLENLVGRSEKVQSMLISIRNKWKRE